MHEASAAVAGGSLRAVEAILRGDVEHAQHPGGGLHHAMAERASGFCIYNDPALAIARARRDGLRVLYIDLDVHHGDGVQDIHWDDPGVLTFSIHETGRALFPGTGEADEVGEGVAAGTSVNVPLPPGTGEGAWLDALTLLLPELAATFGPDLVVSQHGANSHAWDPLAHLNVTVTAHGCGGPARGHDRAPARPRPVAGDRWRRVRRVPGRAPDLGPDLAGRCASRGPVGDATGLARTLGGRGGTLRPGAAPRALRRRARTRGWRWTRCRPRPRNARQRSRRWSGGCWFRDSCRSVAIGAGGTRWLPRRRRCPANGSPDGAPTVLADIDAATWAGLSLAPRVVAPADPQAAHALVLAGLADGARVTGAVVGSTVVGVAISRTEDAEEELLAVGVEPGHRRQGLAAGLLAAHASRERASNASVTLAERDVIEPLDRADRASIARRLLSVAGYRVESASGAMRSVDPSAIVARREPA